jgi:hypothetical protein
MSFSGDERQHSRASPLFRLHAFINQFPPSCNARKEELSFGIVRELLKAKQKGFPLIFCAGSKEPRPWAVALMRGRLSAPSIMKQNSIFSPSPEGEGGVRLSERGRRGRGHETTEMQASFFTTRNQEINRRRVDKVPPLSNGGCGVDTTSILSFASPSISVLPTRIYIPVCCM